MQDITEKQKKVYEFLVEKSSTGLPPTVREIAARLNIKSTSTVHGILSALEEKGLIERDRYNSRAIKIAGTKEVRQIPVLGKVTAGEPILAFEDIKDYIPFSAEHGEGLFALNVSGLSMKNAGILDGDIVVADKQAGFSQGDIVVALIDDEATVKRLAYENGKAVLMPENEDFSPIRPENLEILGKVIGCIRKY
ncbi:MAG: transcriptional repressor LexA [Oscillospiraceae bacterium]|nr:transcriptional repressor LexA [Candidatus Equicaccousia limihippi]